MKKFDFNKFDKKKFEKHIRNSIPNYEGMRSLIPSISENFVTENTNIYDIGCSSGDLLQELSMYLSSELNLSFVGYDIAESLTENNILKNVDIFNRDVTDESLKMFNTDLILSVFTLQFIPTYKRINLVKKAYKSLNKRGCFLVCEKVYNDKGFVEDIFTFSNYQNKINNGFTPLEILEKQRRLKTVMKPLSQKENEDIFREAGFEVVEVFFKSLNFIGWVLIK